MCRIQAWAPLVFALIATAVLFGCDTDEPDEGPDRRALLISSRWYTESAEVVDPDDYESEVEVPDWIEFEDDGTVRSAPLNGTGKPDSGRWRFTDSRDSIVVESGETTVEYDILSLTEEVLRYRYDLDFLEDDPVVEVELSHSD